MLKNIMLLYSSMLLHMPGVSIPLLLTRCNLFHSSKPSLDIKLFDVFPGPIPHSLLFFIAFFKFKFLLFLFSILHTY